MSVTYVDTGYYSSVTGETYPDAASAHAAESQAMGGDLTGGSAATPAARTGGIPMPTDPAERQHAADLAAANDQKAVWDPKSGSWTYVPLSASEAHTNALSGSRQAAGDRLTTSFGGTPTSGAPQDPNAPPADIVAQTRQQLGLDPSKPADLSSREIRPAGAIAGIPTGGAVTTATAAGARFAPPTGFGGTTTPQPIKDAVNPPADPNAPTGAPAPKVDTSASDASVAGVNNTINQLVSLANTSPTTSAAEAQLEKSDQLAKLRAIDELRNNQAASLGAARSSRNRGDAGVLERAAVGESAYLGTKAQNQDVLRQAETENNLASLRANEEQTDFTNRANILSKAADLGLNVAALQVDISKADLGSINNYINDQFQQLGIDKQVGAQEMGQILSFSQAMSAIKYDYDKMGDADQQHTLDLMMTQYGIDANTQVAMKQIQANHKGTLEKVFDGVLGLAVAVAPVAASVITAGAKKPGGTP